MSADELTLAILSADELPLAILSESAGISQCTSILTDTAAGPFQLQVVFHVISCVLKCGKGASKGTFEHLKFTWRVQADHRHPAKSNVLATPLKVSKNAHAFETFLPIVAPPLCSL